MVRHGFPRVCFYFCSTERTSELLSLLLKSSEGNSESLLLFWFHGTEFRVDFSSAEGFGREFWEFASIFVQRNGIPSCFLFHGRVRDGIPTAFCSAEHPDSAGNNHLFRLFRLPRNYFFCRKFPTLGIYPKSHLIGVVLLPRGWLAGVFCTMFGLFSLLSSPAWKNEYKKQ